MALIVQRKMAYPMTAEHEPKRELPTELVKAYAATFIPRWDWCAFQRPNGEYIQRQQPLTLEIVRAHLTNYRDPTQPIVTIGAYALDRDSRAKWVCFDADNEDKWQQLLSLPYWTDGIPAYFETSRRGGHLWLFIEPISGKSARRFAQQLLSEAGVEQTEIYPMQDRLNTPKAIGSLVRLPLGVHRVSGRVHHFINLDGTPLAPTISEQIQLLVRPQLVPTAFIMDVLSRVQDEPVPLPTPPEKTTARVEGETVSERIKATTSTYDFMVKGGYIDLDRDGKGLCPFHEDHRRSFSVNIAEGYWCCFGCRARGSIPHGGSVIDFWMKWRGISFKEAVRELAQMLL